MSRNIYIWFDDNLVNMTPGERHSRIVGARADRPGEDAVWREVTEYIGTFGADIWKHSAGGIFVTFPTSFAKNGEIRQRFLEVHIGPDAVNVVTREMDDITNAIAAGLGRRIAIKFKGRYEEG